MVEIQLLSDLVQIYYIDILGNCKLNCMFFVTLVTIGGDMDISEGSKFRKCPIWLNLTLWVYYGNAIMVSTCGVRLGNICVTGYIRAPLQLVLVKWMFLSDS